MTAIRRDPPERRRRSVTLPAFGCCCCCCCLHTVGSLIGATRASANLLKEAKAPDDPLDEKGWARRSLQRAPVMLYWNAFAVACGLMFSIMLANIPRQDPFEWAVLSLVFLPLPQLAAGLLASLWIGIFSRHPDRGYCHEVVWKITGWAFLGAVLGLLAMGIVLPIVCSGM